MNRTLALPDAAKVIHELTLAYGQPYGLSVAATEDLAKQWAKVLDDCKPADVNTVVEQWIKREKKWPTASRIRDDSLKLAAVQRKPESSFVEGEFCPRCHTRDLISVGTKQRFMPCHKLDCPGLHESDLTDLQAALEANTPIWRNGKPPKAEPTADRVRKHQESRFDSREPAGVP